MKISQNVCSKMWTDTNIDFKRKRLKHCCKQSPHPISLDDLKRLGKNCFDGYVLNIKNRQTMLFGNELPTSCEFCISNFDNSIKHVWNIWSDEYINQNRYELLTSLETNYIEFDIGNSCNMACVYCGSWASTMWAKELGIKDENNLDQEWRITLLKNLQQWLLDFPKDRQVVFNILGGEPTMLPETYEIIEYISLTSEHFITKPKIMITTNLNTKPKLLNRLLDTMNRTKDIFEWELAISIENIGHEAELVRYHLDWELFEENVSKVMNQADFIYFTNTFSLFSLPTFDKFLHWVFNLMGADNYDKTWALSMNYVQDGYSDVAYLRKDQVDLSKIKETYFNYVSDNNSIRSQQFITHVENLYNRTETKVPDDMFFEYWKALETRRNISMNKIESFRQLEQWYYG